MTSDVGSPVPFARFGIEGNQLIHTLGENNPTGKRRDSVDVVFEIATPDRSVRRCIQGNRDEFTARRNKRGSISDRRERRGESLLAILTDTGEQIHNVGVGSRWSSVCSTGPSGVTTSGWS